MNLGAPDGALDKDLLRATVISDLCGPFLKTALFVRDAISQVRLPVTQGSHEDRSNDGCIAPKDSYHMRRNRQRAI